MHLNYCGAVLVGRETIGSCCGANAKDPIGVSFKVRHSNPALSDIYAQKAFIIPPLQLNSLFCSVHCYMDAALAAKFEHSFLRIQGNTSVAIPLTNSRYSSLWLNGPPSLNSEDYTNTFISKAVSDGDVKSLIRDIYQHLSPRP